MRTTIPEEKRDTAWKAVERFRAMVPQLESFLRAATGKNVRIILRGTTGSSTDGENVYLCPPYELGFDLPHNVNLCDRVDSLGYQKCKACAVREEITVNIYHEASHIAFGTFAGSPHSVNWSMLRRWGIKKPSYFRSKSIYRESPYIDKHMTHLLNALEDIRVDRAMYKARPGLERMGLMSDRQIAEGLRTQTDGTPWRWLDQPLDAQVLTALYFRGKYGQLIPGMYASEIEELFTDTKLAKLVDQTITTEDCVQSFELGCKILFRVRELGFLQTAETFTPPPPEPEPEPEPEQEPEPNDERDAAEPSDASASTDAKESDDSEQDGGDSDEPDDSAEDSEDESESSASSGSDHGDDEEQSDSDDGEMSEDSSDSGAGESPEEPAEHEPGISDEDSGGGEPGSESYDNEDFADQDVDGTSPDGGADDESSDQAGDTGDGGSDDGADDGDASDSGDGGSAGGSDLASSDANGDPEDQLNDDSDSGLQRPATDGATPTQAGTPDPDADASADALDAPTGESVAVRPPQTFQEYVERHGDDELLKAVIELLTGHAEDIELGGTPNTEIIQTAVQQSEFFEESSGNIQGVVEYKPDDLHGWQELEMGSSWIQQEFRKQMDDVKISPGLMNQALMKMRRAFEENRRAKHERNLNRGRVNKRSLGRRAWSGDDRLFEKKQLPKQLDYAVVIGVDISGSTYGGTRMQMEKTAVWAQADLLDRVGVSFSIVAHTGEDVSLERATAKGYQSGDYLATLTVKDFDEPWGSKQKEALFNLYPYSANIDGHAFEYMRKKVEARSEEKKLIMYYSDGSMPLENFREELAILQRELKYCKRRGIGVAAVGIFNNEPQRKYGIPMVLFESESDILPVIDHVAASLGIG